MSSATITDVARRVGVSESTVSRFVSGFKVRKHEEIQAAIDDLGYRPNHMARNLKSGKTGAIAVIVPDVMNPFFAAIVQGVEVSAGDDYIVSLINTGDDAERELSSIQRLIGRVDGIIYVPSHEKSPALELLNEGKIPVVFVDRVLSEMDSLDSVLADNERGGELAGRHFIDHGHDRIAIISGPLDSTPGKLRYRGFLKALNSRANEIRSEFLVESDFTELGGYQAMKSLLALENRPTAVFVANNFMTVGALKALSEESISIPSEIAIIGFDDLQLSELIDPPLTVIARDAQMQGAQAMRLLHQRVCGIDQIPLQHLKIDVELIARGSCGSTCRHSNRGVKSSNVNLELSKKRNHLN